MKIHKLKGAWSLTQHQEYSLNIYGLVVVALAEDLDLIPVTHMVAFSHLEL